MTKGTLSVKRFLVDILCNFVFFLAMLLRMWLNHLTEKKKNEIERGNEYQIHSFQAFLKVIHDIIFEKAFQLLRRVPICGHIC